MGRFMSEVMEAINDATASSSASNQPGHTEPVETSVDSSAPQAATDACVTGAPVTDVSVPVMAADEDEPLLLTRGRAMSARKNRLQLPKIQTPFPLMANHEDLLFKGHDVDSRILEANGCFSVPTNSAGRELVRKLGFTQDQVPEDEAIGIVNYGLRGELLGYTMMPSKPRLDAQGHPIPFENSSDSMPRVGVLPSTRTWMRDIDPVFPFVWSHDALHCLMAASYGLHAFHLVNGQSGDESAERDHIRRSLKALQAEWMKPRLKPQYMPQHLLIRALGDHHRGRFDAMDVVAQELRQFGIDVLELHVAPSNAFQPASEREVVGEILFVELLLGPLSQRELERNVLGPWSDFIM